MTLAMDIPREKARNAFEKAQQNPDLGIEFSEVAGYMDSGIIETIFTHAFIEGWEEGYDQGYQHAREDE